MAQFHILAVSVIVAISYSILVKGDCCSLDPIENLHLLPRNCREIQLKGTKEDGIYTIYPLSWTQPINVYCDLTTDSGG